MREKYPNTFQVYELLYDKVFAVKIPAEKFLSITENYFRIRDERNHSAHARADYSEFKTAKKLREAMSNDLDEIAGALTAE